MFPRKPTVTEKQRKFLRHLRENPSDIPGALEAAGVSDHTRYHNSAAFIMRMIRNGCIRLEVNNERADDGMATVNLSSMEVDVTVGSLAREKNRIYILIKEGSIKPSEGAAWVVEIESAMEKLVKAAAK